jgi:hypothetical protein
VAAEYVKATVGTADMAIVLGSGMMEFVDRFSQNPPPKVRMQHRRNAAAPDD